MGEKGEKRPLATPRGSQQVEVVVVKLLLLWPWLAVELVLNGSSLLDGALGLAHTGGRARELFIVLDGLVEFERYLATVQI